MYEYDGLFQTATAFVLVGILLVVTGLIGLFVTAALP